MHLHLCWDPVSTENRTLFANQRRDTTVSWLKCIYGGVGSFEINQLLTEGTKDQRYDGDQCTSLSEPSIWASKLLSFRDL